MPIRRLVIAVLVFCSSILAGRAESLVGSWHLVADSDGNKPRPNAVLTLTFEDGGTLKFKAVQPGETVDDKGTYQVRNGRITLHFDELDNQGCDNQPYTLQGPALTLPFKMLSGGPGKSTWRSATAGTAPADGNSILGVILAELKEAQQHDNARPRAQIDITATQDASLYKGGTAEAYYAQGVAFYLRTYLYEAWYCFAKASSLEPQNAVYLNNLSSVLIALDRNVSASTILGWVTKFFPNLDSPFANLGIAQLRAEECSAARASLLHALQLAPENGMYEDAICKADRCLGKEDEAKKYCALAWAHGYSGGGDGGGDGEDTGGDKGDGKDGGKDRNTPPGSTPGTTTGGKSGGTGKGTPAKPAPRPKPQKPDDRKHGIPPEWVGNYQAQYVRARSGESTTEANTQFGQGLTGTNINLKTLACAKEFTMQIAADGSITGHGKVMYVYQGKAINPAMMLAPMVGVAQQGGFATNLKGGYQVRDWSFTGTIDEDGNIEVNGVPGQDLDLLNVGKYQKIKPWSAFPADDRSHMRGPFHMTLTVEENTNPVIHVDQWLDLGDKLIRRVHYQARIVKSDTAITPDCRYEKPKKPKCPARESMKSKIKYAPKNGLTVEVSKDLGTGEISSKYGDKLSGDSGSVEAGVDSKGNVSLEGQYGSATGSAKVNINDGSYQVSVGVGVDTGKLTPKGFPGKIKEKLELTYDSKCGWGIKGQIGGEAFGASASIEGTVFLTQGPR